MIHYVKCSIMSSVKKSGFIIRNSKPIKYQLLDRFTKSLKVTELLFFNHFIYMLCFKQMVSFTWQLIVYFSWNSLLKLLNLLSNLHNIAYTVLPRSIAPRFIANLAYCQNSRLSRFPPLKIPRYTAKLSFRHRSSDTKVVKPI